MKIISWFSAGISSAVATKKALEKYRKMEIIYIHIDDQHQDTSRFIKDCEKWFGQKITVLQSELKNVENACLKAGFVNSPYGASCTRLLKRRVRSEWENNGYYKYIWGFDYSEKNRADRIVEKEIFHQHEFPLIDLEYNKGYVHGIFNKTGIARPKMYDLGYPNNNCVGCLKGGMGYWNKIKKDFPEIFSNRCEMEEKIGGKIFKDFWLTDLPENAGREPKIIVPDCGLFCDEL